MMHRFGLLVTMVGAATVPAATLTAYWVLCRPASLLADAGIDTVIFDTTNRKTDRNVYLQLCAVWTQVRQRGGRTPQICFMGNTKAGDTAQASQVQADSKDWKPWGNRTCDETVKLKDKFPVPYRSLAEMDPQSLGGKVHPIELYDLKTDPDALHDLAGAAGHRAEPDRLYAALCQWIRDTAGTAVQPPATFLRVKGKP